MTLRAGKMLGRIFLINLLFGCLVKAESTSIKVGYVLTPESRDEEAMEFSAILRNFSDSDRIKNSNLSYEYTLIDARQQLATAQGLYPWLEEQLSNKSVSYLIGRYNRQVAALTSIPFYLISDGFIAAEIDGTTLVTSLLPSLNVGIMALAGFMQYPKSYCKEFVIITQTSDDLRTFLISWRHLASKVALPCVVEFPVVIPMVDNSTLHPTARKLLSDVRTTAVRMIILHSNNLVFIREIIKLAGMELDMMNRYDKWFLTYMAKDALPPVVYETFKESAATVNIMNADLDRAVFRHYNISEPNPATVLRQAAMLDSLIIIHTSVKQGGENETTEVNGVTGDLSSDYLEKRRERFPMESYVVEHSQPIKMVTSAVIGNTTYFNKADLGYTKPPKGMPLISKTILRIGVPNVPAIFSNDSGTPEGVVVDLFSNYSRELAVKFVLVPFSGYHFHEDMSDALKSGLVDGIVNSDQLDTLSIDMTSPIITNELSMLFRNSDNSDDSAAYTFAIFKLLFKPFTLFAWIVIIVAFFLVALLLVLITGVDKTTKILYPSETFYTAIAILMLGHSDKVASTIPSRVLVAFFIFFAFTIISAYLANLTRFFVWSAAGGGVQTMQLTAMSQLATQGRLKFGVVRESQAASLLEKSTSYPENLLWSTIQRDRMNLVLPSYEQAVKKVKRGKFVLIGETIILRNLARGDCSLQTVTPSGGVEIRYKVGFGRGLPYISAFNSAISTVNSNGTNAAIISKYTKNKCQDDVTTTSEDLHELKPYEMIPIFCILFIGILLSFISALCACIVAKFNRDRAWRKYKK